MARRAPAAELGRLKSSPAVLITISFLSEHDTGRTSTHLMNRLCVDPIHPGISLTALSTLPPCSGRPLLRSPTCSHCAHKPGAVTRRAFFPPSLSVLYFLGLCDTWGLFSGHRTNHTFSWGCPFLSSFMMKTMTGPRCAEHPPHLPGPSWLPHLAAGTFGVTRCCNMNP